MILVDLVESSIIHTRSGVTVLSDVAWTQERALIH